MEKTVTNVCGDLTVNSTYTNATQNGQTFAQLTGTVVYGGVTGALNGYAGNEELLGLFEGTQDTTAYAGGFSVID